MSDPNDTVKKETLKMATPGKLQLTKTVESGKVKQNFTHGRSKSVTVEVRKTRTFAPGGSSGGLVEVKKPLGGGPSMPVRSGEPESLRQLTADERQFRMKALQVAEETSRQIAERGGPSPSQEQVTDAPDEAFELQPLGKDGIVMAPVKRSGETPNPAIAKKPGVTAPTPNKPAPSKILVRPPREGEEEAESARRGDNKGGKLRLKYDEGQKMAGKITVSQALSNLEDQRVRSLASIRRQREKALKKAS